MLGARRYYMGRGSNEPGNAPRKGTKMAATDTQAADVVMTIEWLCDDCETRAEALEERRRSTETMVVPLNTALYMLTAVLNGLADQMTIDTTVEGQ